VLTAKGGEGKVPEGKVGATGTQGTGTEPAGPSYGPGAGPGGPLPVYPKNALDQGMEGTVTLAITVSPQGKVAAVRVAKSSGHKLLDEAARRSVAAWTFTPGMKAGKPAEGVVTVGIRFAKNAVERF
jgi:protein TonB